MTRALPSEVKSTTDRSNATREAIRTFISGLSRNTPGLAARLAEQLFTWVPRTVAPEKELLWAAHSSRSSIPWRRGSLTTWSWGKDRSLSRVLLVHGWGGRGLQLGGFAAPLVAAGHRVVTFDGPGHGASSGRRSNLLDMARGITTAAEHLGPFTGIIGHSIGATAAVYALSQGRLATSRVVAIAPPSRMHAVTERFRAMAGFTPEVLDRMRRRFEARLGFRWDDLEPGQLGASLDSSLLVIHDRHDREIPWQEGSALAEASPAARFVLTQRLGHRRILRDPVVIDLATEHLSTANEEPMKEGGQPSPLPKTAAAAGISS